MECPARRRRARHRQVDTYRRADPPPRQCVRRRTNPTVVQCAILYRIMTKHTTAIDPQIPSLVARLLERRKLTLFQEVRHEREVIAERMAAAGTLRSGGFVVA